MESGIEKRCIIELLRNRYRRAQKKEKGIIIDELIAKLDVSRKHAIRLLNPQNIGRPRKPGKAGRPSKYRDYEFVQALRLTWRIMLQMCGSAMKAGIPDWLPAIEQERGKFDDKIRTLLLSISAPTINRILKPFKIERGRSHTRSGGFREQIPIQGNIWDIGIPGHIETDTVAHCGGSMLGEFINSLTVVDIATLWTEVRAVFGRGSNSVITELKYIESILPFSILAYDADNGGEVLNEHILSYFQTERAILGLPTVQVTRSRPYKKNDNAHVEQRNDSVVRKYLGYERLAFVELIPLVNYYYSEILCPLINHFVPSFKLKQKVKVLSRNKRIYEVPKTPYQRVMESVHVPEVCKKKLQAEHLSLNPVRLRELEKITRVKIDQALKKLKIGVDPRITIPEHPMRETFRDLSLVARAARLKSLLTQQQAQV